MKTKTKQYQCPGCEYKTPYAGAITNHIKGNHDGVWKGTLSATLGIEDTPGAIYKRTKYKQKKLAPKIDVKRKNNAAVRARYLARGLTTGGKPRQRAVRPETLARYNLNGKALVTAQEQPAVTVAVDITGDAARAILIAAEVLKDITAGIQARAMRR